MLIYTDHARLRMRQRNIPRQAVEFVFTYGRSSDVHGATQYVLSRHSKHVPEHPPSWEKLGVMVKDGNVVVTVYRERKRRRRLRARDGVYAKLRHS